MENRKQEQGRTNRILAGAMVAKQGTNHDHNQPLTNCAPTFGQSGAEWDTVYTAGDGQPRETFVQRTNRRLVAEETARRQETRKYKKPTTRDAGFNQYVMESDSDSDEIARHQETRKYKKPTTEVEQSKIYDPSHCHGQQFSASAQQYPTSFYPTMGGQFGAQLCFSGQRMLMIPLQQTIIPIGIYQPTGQQFGTQAPYCFMQQFPTNAQQCSANIYTERHPRQFRDLTTRQEQSTESTRDESFYNGLRGASEDIDEFQTPRKNAGRRRD